MTNSAETNPFLTEVGQKPLEERFTELEKQLDYERTDAAYFREQYQDAVRSMMAQEDQGWKLIRGVGGDDDDDNLSNEQLQDITKQLRTWASTNPLLARGKEIRASYLFGSGYEIGTEDATSKISARAWTDILDPLNQASVFGPEALIAAEGDRFSNGQHYALFDKGTRRFSCVPFTQIEDAIYNPEDAGEVWYYQRSYNQRVVDLKTGKIEVKDTVVWYPVDTYKVKARLTQIDGHPVDYTKVIVDSRVNRPTGATWGVPDSFSAAPWALAYSAYLRDGTKVLASLAEWAWKLSPKGKNGADRAGAKVKTQGAGAGGVAVTDMDLQALPRANAVDLNTGRPLASQVAAALGISVVILLSDPGQSGAYGTAQTLTDPSIRTMKLRQDMVGDFLCRCLKLLGIVKPAIVWEKMSPDVDYREMQTVNMALGSGLFHADEVRPISAKLAGITLLHPDAPDGYLDPNNVKSLARKDIDADSSAKPALDGSNELTNGQGKNNTKVGKVSAGDHTGDDDLTKD